jgi:putative NADPH-quinone reductase
MADPIVIFGSAREQGDTRNAVQMVVQDRSIPIISLGQLNFSTFDYDYRNQADDFAMLARRMIAHDPIMLATPIYWYSMSAIMKSFIDRWNDFTTHTKDVGRQMRGKTLYVIASYSVHPDGKAGFETVFVQTCTHMGIRYGGCFFHYSGDDQALIANNPANARLFAQRIFSGA